MIASQYAAAQTVFNVHGAAGCLGREHEELREEYEGLNLEYLAQSEALEELRRPFSMTAEKQYTDVWDFDPVQHYPGKHPCEKPLDLLEHMIETSTREGDTVLDMFMGSGKTGEACKKLNRNFIGIEKDPRDFQKAKERIDNA